MLDYWARTGLLKPSGRDASGKGSRRQYTFQDVIALLTICKLREGNCPLQKIRSAVRYLRSHYPEATESEPLSRLTLLTDGRKVYMLTDEHLVMEVVTRQMVWSVPLGKLIADANRRVESLDQEWDEEVNVSGRSFRIRLSRTPDRAGYAAECRELPGILEHGATVSAVLGQSKQAIASVIEFRGRKHRQSRVAEGAAS